MNYRILFPLIALTSLSDIPLTYASAPDLESEEENVNKRAPLDQTALNLMADASIQDSYQKIHAHWQYATTPESFATNSPYWTVQRVTLDDGKETAVPIWQSETAPLMKTALEDILQSSSHLDCLSASRMAKSKLIVHTLGSHKTHHLVEITKDTGKKPNSYDFLSVFSWSFQTECSEDFQGVYFMSFVNIPWYEKYKPTGNAGNHNVVRLSDRTFMGFDPAFFSHPRTYDELEYHMYEEFISADHLVDEEKDEYQAFCHVLADDGGFDSFKRLRREHQKKFQPYRFDLAKINYFFTL
ncbi:MAG: hypothetical protein H2057_04460 [Alphaproteobacteria bacterium]|nr:hypothetical protein [Alphaproteobacteria bacterium]